MDRLVNLRQGRLALFLLHIFSLSLIFLPSPIEGHSDGAPSTRCETMVPGHWVSPQTTLFPYKIQLDKDRLEEGDRLSINLTATEGHPGFKGFLILPQAEATPTYFGSFDLFKSDLFQAKPLHCFGLENSAMTHKDSVEKRFLHLEWIAPKLKSLSDEVFLLRVTLVQNFYTFWTAPTIRFVVTKNNFENGNDTAIGIVTTTTTRPTPRPFIVYSEPVNNNGLNALTPQLRDAEAVQRAPTENLMTPNSNGGVDVNGNGNSKLSGSWEHFKQSWMNFLRYFGF